jgi:hypothetical protein
VSLLDAFVVFARGKVSAIRPGLAKVLGTLTLNACATDITVSLANTIAVLGRSSRSKSVHTQLHSLTTQYHIHSAEELIS